MGKNDPARATAIRERAATAAVVPLTTACVCRQVLSELATLGSICNRNLTSDVDVATHLASAALQSAAINVRVNIPLVDEAAAERLESELASLTLDRQS